MILLVAAAWVGLTLAEKRAERYGISKDELNNITFYGLLAFIIGGRLSFVLQNISTFLKSPSGIISINPDIFDPIGATAVALIFMLVYGQRRNLSLWHTLDALTPFFAILFIGIGLSHLAAGTGRAARCWWLLVRGTVHSRRTGTYEQQGNYVHAPNGLSHPHLDSCWGRNPSRCCFKPRWPA